MTKWKSTTNELQNTTQKTKDRATRTPLKTGDEHRCSGRVGSSCSTCGTCCVTHMVICHEWGKDRIVISTNGTYPWLYVCLFVRFLLVIVLSVPLLVIVLSVPLLVIVLSVPLLVIVLSVPLLVIVLSVPFRFTILIKPLVSSNSLTGYSWKFTLEKCLNLLDVKGCFFPRYLSSEWKIYFH